MKLIDLNIYEYIMKLFTYGAEFASEALVRKRKQNDTNIRKTKKIMQGRIFQDPWHLYSSNNGL